MNKKQIAVIGLGGVGGYYGFKINQAKKHHQLTFVARGKTFETVKSKGLTLLSPEHEQTVTRPDAIIEHISELKQPDLVLLCVKVYDLENICLQLKEVISNDTIILPMMNGADIYERIRSILPENPILPSCVYVASHIKDKGIVEHKGKPAKLYIGKDPQHTDIDVSWMTELLSASGVNFTFRTDALPDIWTKYIFIASFGLVTARYNSSIGTVCSDALQKKRAWKIMEEIEKIAYTQNITLAQDIIGRTFQKASTFPAQTPTSLQLDIHSGKGQSELELFSEAIMKMGKEAHIETPHTEAIHREIIEFTTNKQASL